MKKSKTRQQITKQLKRIRAKRLFRTEFFTPGFKLLNYPSTNTQSYKKFGKSFLKKFQEEKTIFAKRNRSYLLTDAKPHESQYGLAVRVKQNPTFDKIGWIGLGFTKDTLIIESIQTERNLKNRLNEFRRETKQQVLDYLLKIAEERARELGFKSISIRRPETLYYYQKPTIGRRLPLTKEEVQKSMRIIYARTATKNGYKRNARFYTKNLQ